MGAGHGHAHAEGRGLDRKRLQLVLLVTVAVVLGELLGAWLSGYLALLADAGHMVTDAAAVAVGLSASYLAGLPATSRRTFGLHRAEMLAALVNAVVLPGGCGFLGVVGAHRLVNPVPVVAGPMLAFATVGIVAHALSLTLLA